ncbi:single-stranded DNA-binding protein [Carnobacterium sp.]|uniref:single-stranded DNA-binding protein n=1 Tax=Carnobacterium sp. TaxID=48221 RepID=UPI0038900C2B
MINYVVLVGRLTKDADLKFTGNGSAVASFTLAVNRSYKKENENQKADFVNCVVWRKTAEALANHTSKGSLIGVEGRIQTRSYDNNQGQRVYVTEVVAEEVTFLESKKTGAQSNGDNQQTNTQQYNSNQSSNQNSNQYYNSDPFDKSSTPIDIEDDDLPF